MAEIYLAEQEGPGGFRKKLVIKQILQSFAEDENFKTMFQDEARLVAQLTHPKIAQIYELGEVDRSLFIAMEYVEGVDLNMMIEWAHTHKTFVPIDIAVKVMSDLLEALDYAHDFSMDGMAYNLIHRDVTPHNVMVSNDGIVKLLDFGVAKALANQSKTQAGAVKGKFAYMAPEQVENKTLDRRVDIFAAGVVMYELLCNEKPFGDDLGAIINVVSKPTPDIRVLRPEVPEALARIIVQALQKDPNHRFVDAHAMAAELQGFMRASGMFVGDREVASFVRQMQGLPMTRSSGAVRSTVSEQAPQGISQTQSGPQHTIATPPPVAAPLFQTPEAMSSNQVIQSTAELPQIKDLPPDSHTQPVSVADSETKKMLTIFVVLLLAVAVVAGILLSQLIKPKDTQPEIPVKNDPVAKVETKTPTKTEPTIPAAFNHAGGHIVSVSSKPEAELIFEGQSVGRTPVQTNLRPGSYTVTLKNNDKSVTKTFTVIPGKPIQRFPFEL
jgi:serine/threonine protein kinase